MPLFNAIGGIVLQKIYLTPFQWVFLKIYANEIKVSSLKWLYSKQPKLGLTQEFVMDCAHALWVVHSTERLVTLMLLKWFLSYSFIYFMYRMLNEIF